MFNLQLYKSFNPDLNNLNNMQLINHWNNVGKYENRISSIETFKYIYPDFIPNNPNNIINNMIEYHINYKNNKIINNKNYQLNNKTIKNNNIEQNNQTLENNNLQQYNKTLENKNNNNKLVTFILICNNINKTISTINSLNKIKDKLWNLFIFIENKNINNIDLNNIDLNNNIKIFNKKFNYKNIKNLIETPYSSILIEGIYINSNYFYNLLNYSCNFDILVFRYYINENIILPINNLNDNIPFTFIFKKELTNEPENIIIDMKYKYNVILSKYINYYYFFNDENNINNFDFNNNYFNLTNIDNINYLLPFINPNKLILLIEFNNINHYFYFYINALSSINFFNMNILILYNNDNDNDNNDKIYQFINSLNGHIIDKNTKKYNEIFEIANIIISSEFNEKYLSTKIFLPDNKKEKELKGITYFSNEKILVNNYITPYNKYNNNNEINNPIYLNQYMKECIKNV